jgi:hypothetical protein
MQDGSIMLAFGRRYGLIGRNGAPLKPPIDQLVMTVTPSRVSRMDRRLC